MDKEDARLTIYGIGPEQDNLSGLISALNLSDRVFLAGFVEDVVEFDFGAAPHTLIFPGKLHFMEAEALVELGDAPKQVLELAQ